MSDGSTESTPENPDDSGGVTRDGGARASRLFKVLAESTSDGIIVIDATSRILFANRAAHAMFGYDDGELTGGSLARVIPQELRAAHAASMDRYLEDGERRLDWTGVSLPGLRKDGSRVELEVSFGEMARGGQRYFTGVLREVTMRRAAERREAAQFAVAAVLAEAETLGEATEPVLRSVAESCGWEMAELWEILGDTGELHRIGCWSAPGVSASELFEVSQAMCFRAGDGLPGQVVETRAAIWAENLDADTRIVRALLPTKGGLRSAAAFPIWRGKNVTGVLTFFANAAIRKTGPVDQMMATLGRQLGGFMARKHAEEELRRLHRAIETIQIGVTVAGPDGTIFYTNPAEAAMHGYTLAELEGLRDVAVFAPRESRRPIPAEDLAGVSMWRRESVNVRKGGDVFPVQLTSDVIRDEQGRPLAIVTTCEDITDRKRTEEAVQLSEQRYRALFERNLAGVFRATRDGRIIECNDAATRIFGFEAREQLLEHRVPDLYFGRDELRAFMASIDARRVLTNVELQMRKRDGTPVWVLVNASLMDDTELGAQIIEGTLVDITDRKHAEEKVQHQALHDPLTDLANRQHFNDRLAQEIVRARRGRKRLGVLFLDLDHFKLVNDSLGHTAGDELLRLVADRLNSCVRTDDIVARVGGDEFTVLLPGIAGVDDAGRVARKIIQRMVEPYFVYGRELYATTSVGIAIYPLHGEGAETLVANADAAMYRAKELGRNNYQFYRPAAARPAVEELDLETSLRHSLERGELIVEYQPQIDLASGLPQATEALLRWRHPTRGVMPPLEFIPLAESTGLILPVGEWVFRTACLQARAWRQSGYTGARVAVNFSPRQFEQGGLRRMIHRVLAETGAEPADVEMEITESVAMKNLEQTLPVLREIADMGMRIAIDDFGIGHSSLSYLRFLPIHTLKVDHSFVRDIGNDQRESAIVRAIIDLAHNLGLRVVAEGVERDDQLEELRRLGCDAVQGFLLARPMGAAQAEVFLAGAAGTAGTISRG